MPGIMEALLAVALSRSGTLPATHPPNRGGWVSGAHCCLSVRSHRRASFGERRWTRSR